VSDLSPAQEADFKQAFALFDRNGDGHITPKELQAVMGCLGQSPADEEVGDMMTEADLDGDGVINFNDFCELLLREDDTTIVEDEITSAFDTFAGDRGYIDEHDLERMMKMVGEEITLQEARDMIAEADTDHDGKISLEEFGQMLM